ncbi:MAG: CsbD family protein [Sulfuritalea sp.]|nr:CsbD family protein [Sulfuritalea sp.]MCF8199681.1 CsbD family protein [Sulfuritalea sp.]
MNMERIEGMWQQFAGWMKQTWGERIDDPLRAAAGRRERIIGRLQRESGIEREQSVKALKEFWQQNRHWNH